MNEKSFYKEPIAVIDIGTTKICVLIAQQIDTNNLKIIALATGHADGMQKGIVVDVDKAIHSIKTTLKLAQSMTEFTVKAAYLGISGNHIQSINSHGVTSVKKSIVTDEDIHSSLASAQTIVLPEGQKILHVLPQYYCIDSNNYVKNPLSMHGIRLEAHAHIITASISCIQNLTLCCQKAGIEVIDVIFEPIASALAIATPDEQHMGVAILDIGGGTSNLVIYHHNNIVHTQVLPIAGNHFTNDLAVGLRITLHEAEKIKQSWGFVCPELLEQDGTLEIESVQGDVRKNVPLRTLYTILQPRTQELFELVDYIFHDKKLKQRISSGLILTGGGALLKGINRLASKLLTIPVRIGTSTTTGNFAPVLNNPKYATTYGLLLYVLQQKNCPAIANVPSSSLQRVTTRMKSLISDLF